MDEGSQTVDLGTEPVTDTKTGPFPTAAAAPMQAEKPGESLDDVHPLTLDTTLILTDDVLNDLRVERTALDDARRAATAALRTAEASVCDGAAVTTAVLEPVETYTALLAKLAERVTGVAGPVQARLGDIDAALDQFSESLTASMRIKRIQRLRQLSGPHANAVAVLVDQLHDTLDDDTPLREALTLLVDLLDLLADGAVVTTDPQRLLELQTQIMAGLPGDLAPVPMAAITGQLYWADATPSVAAAVSPDAGVVLPQLDATMPIGPGRKSRP